MQQIRHQASIRPERKIEILNANREKSTIVTFGVKGMHGSMLLPLARKAMNFCSKNLPEEGKKKMGLALELLQAGMQNVLLTFQGKCCARKGNGADGNVGPAIGSFELAFLVNPVAPCMLEKTTNHFSNVKCRGAHRGDGFCVLNETCTMQGVCNWPTNFQKDVGKMAKGTFFQFATGIWKEGQQPTPPMDETTTTTKNSFPFLGVDLHWGKSGNLQFKVCSKPGQRIECVEKGSAHAPAAIACIPNCVLKRLVRMLTIGKSNKNKTIQEVRPEHAEALAKAKPVHKFPTMKEALKKGKQGKIERTEKEKKNNNNKKDNRNVHFAASFSRFWTKKTPQNHNKNIEQMWGQLHWSGNGAQKTHKLWRKTASRHAAENEQRPDVPGL